MACAMKTQRPHRRLPGSDSKELKMADYGDCIRNMPENASVLGEVAQKREDKRAELCAVVDFLEATATRLGNGTA